MQRSPRLISSEGRGPHGRCPLAPAVDGSTVNRLRVRKRRFQLRGCLVCRQLHEHGVSRRNRRHGGHGGTGCFGIAGNRERGRRRAKAQERPPRRRRPQGQRRCRAVTLDWVRANCERRESRLAGGQSGRSVSRTGAFGWRGMAFFGGLTVETKPVGCVFSESDRFAGDPQQA